VYETGLLFHRAPKSALAVIILRSDHAVKAASVRQTLDCALVVVGMQGATVIDPDLVVTSVMKAPAYPQDECLAAFWKPTCSHYREPGETRFAGSVPGGGRLARSRGRSGFAKRGP